MSVIKKPDLKIFAQDAKTGEIESFPDILRGWGITLERTAGKPPLEWFNAIGKRVDEWLMYLTQRGVAEWDASLSYPKTAIVQFNNIVYVSVKETKGEQPDKSQASWSTLGLFLGLDKYSTTAAMNLELNKKFDKANISGVKGNDNDKVPSLNLFTTEIGKLQPKGEYASGLIFSVVSDYTRMQSPSLSYRAVITDAGSFMVINGATSNQVFGFNASGELISGKVPVERLTGLSQTTGSSKTAVMSQDAATKAFQPVGNYADGDKYTATTAQCSIKPNDNYGLLIQSAGVAGVWSNETNNWVWSFSSRGTLTAGAVPFERLTGVSTDANGMVRTGNSTALTTADRTVSLGTSTTLVATQKLVNDVNSKLIGVGQTWRHMHATGERKANIVYTNDKGRATGISVTYRTESGNSLAALTVKINGFPMARQVSRYSESEKAVNITMIVPPGATYEVVDVAGALYLWGELS